MHKAPTHLYKQGHFYKIPGRGVTKHTWSIMKLSIAPLQSSHTKTDEKVGNICWPFFCSRALQCLAWIIKLEQSQQDGLGGHLNAHFGPSIIHPHLDLWLLYYFADLYLYGGRESFSFRYHLVFLFVYLRRICTAPATNWWCMRGGNTSQQYQPGTACFNTLGDIFSTYHPIFPHTKSCHG